MSASREKKQRTDNVSDLSQKQLRDLKEAQAQKQKKTIYTVVGIVLAALVAALLIWSSGVFQKGQVAATVNGQEFTVAQASYYYGELRQREIQMAQLGISFGMPLYNSTQPAKSQIQDAATGTTFAQYFETQTLESLKQVALLCDEAEASGYVLSDEGKANVETQMETIRLYAKQQGVSAKTYLRSLFGKYMTEDVFREETLRTTLASEYSAKKANDFTYSDELLNTYYKEHAETMDTYEYHYAQIKADVASTVDAEGNTVPATDEEKAAAMSAVKEQADAMAAELGSGADFADTAAKYVTDVETDYRHQTGDLGSGLASTTYGQWLVSAETPRGAGDIGVVEDTTANCYYVVKLVKRWLADDSYATMDARHILVKAAMDEGATEPTQAQYDAAKARVEELKAEWEAGPKTAESFGALAEQHSEDPGSKENGGLYEGITRNQMFTAFNDFLFASGRKVGDMEIVQNTQSGQQGYHLIYIEAPGKLYWKNTAEATLRSDDYNAWYDGIAEGYDAQAAGGISYLIR